MLNDNRNPDVVEILVECVGCQGIYDEIYDDGLCECCAYELDAKLDAFTDGEL